jgi:di/tricarboxylate transporter
MTFPTLLTLFVTLIAAVLLVSERLRPDLIALMVLVTLGISGVVTPTEAFAGFSGSAVLTIIAVSILSEGLRQTGATVRLGRRLQQLGGKSEVSLILVTILISAFLSLFMNNIAAVGVLLPIVMSLCRHSGLSPARLMLPLAYGTTLGGMATLLTTSNIIVSGALRDAGFKPFGLLDFLPIGIPVVAIGTIYMILIGRRLMPQKTPQDHLLNNQELLARLTKLYGIHKNLCEISVMPDSPLANKTIRDGGWGCDLRLNVVGLARGGQIHMAPDSTEMILGGDVILAQGKADANVLAKNRLNLLAHSIFARRVTGGATTLAEIVLSPHTTLTGKTLREFHFREKYGMNVLAIWRAGHPIRSEYASLPLQGGDALLVQGTLARLHMLKAENDFIVLEEDPEALYQPCKSILAMLITFLTLGIASLDWMPVPYIALAGAVLMVLTGCMSMNDAYRSIEWKAIFLIAGMWPLSTAILSSGLAVESMNLMIPALGVSTPLMLAGVLLIFSLIVTQLMGGQVASLVLAPMALAAAGGIGVDPRAMGMAVALGCSLAFPTPFGHPVNLLVMGPGGYTIKDYLRVGIPLTVLVMATILIGLNIYWQL